MTQQASVRIRLGQVLDQVRGKDIDLQVGDLKVLGFTCSGRGWTVDTDHSRDVYPDQHVIVDPDGTFTAIDAARQPRSFSMKQRTPWVPEYQPEPFKVSWASGYRPLGDETGALFLIEGRIVGEDNESQLVCARNEEQARRIFAVDLEDKAGLGDTALMTLENNHGATHVIESCYPIGTVEEL